MATVPEPDPFAPSIEIYVRPAMNKDAAGLTAVYNYYIAHSNIPEDQTAITEQDMLAIIENARDDKLPFMVAVKGRVPPVADAQGRPGPKKYILPQFEVVVGFALTEIFNFGFAGGRNGRSRATANLQLFVHHEYSHKGVGRNLLDCLIHSMTPAYGFKNAVNWINPDNDKTYYSEGRAQWHQMYFQVPVDGKQDPNFAHIQEFLGRFYFKETARLASAVRKSPNPGPAKFLDLVIFQCEATNEHDFPAFT